MLTLYTNALCPYAHRARLTLAEKGISAARIEIDLLAKPPEFAALTPGGSVPVLAVHDSVLWESAVIAEYLEDSYPEPALLPRDPLLRACARIWIRFADSRLYAHSSDMLHSRDPAVHATCLARICEDLVFMERKAFARDANEGPYWLGTRFSLVDAAFYPWFEQRAALERFFGFAWPAGCTRLLEWERRVAARPGVRAEARPPAFYVNAYGLRASS